MNTSDENTLAVWGRKIMRKLFGPVKVHGLWRISTNQELMDLYREPDMISEIRRRRRIQWLGMLEECQKKKL